MVHIAKYSKVPKAKKNKKQTLNDTFYTKPLQQMYLTISSSNPVLILSDNGGFIYI